MKCAKVWVDISYSLQCQAPYTGKALMGVVCEDYGIKLLKNKERGWAPCAESFPANIASSIIERIFVFLGKNDLAKTLFGISHLPKGS